MDYISLSNGVKVPALGIGTFMITAEDTENSVYEALKMGYRMVDTANAYMNEEAVGRALQRAFGEGIVSRDEVFVSTKIWATLYENDNAVNDTLKRLQLEYVDLLFIHQPAGNFVAGYRLIEKAYRECKARSIGISNFHGEKLERLIGAAEVMPHVIQLETHPYRIQHEVEQRLSEYGTRTMGWYPLGHGDKELVEEPIFAAIGSKYGKTPAQVILRWATQKGFITIPGSKTPAHIKDNLDCMDFTMTADEMAEIGKLEGKKTYYQPDEATEERYASMHLPFENQKPIDLEKQQRDLSHGARFDVGEANPYGRTFTGRSFLKVLATDKELGVTNVTFEPGCRNFWHIHHGRNQILICVAGEGWYQEEGKPAQRLKPGDVVNIPTEVKHWHGATAGSWFSHLVPMVMDKETGVTWLEPVADEDYDALEP